MTGLDSMYIQDETTHVVYILHECSISVMCRLTVTRPV